MTEPTPRRRAQSSSYDLSLCGTFGTFSVSNRNQEPYNKSSSCLYFQTSITLSPQDKLLRHVRPVREIFSSDKLEFDEIMQRDLDDFRIATELIPYLLDRGSKDVFKLFPPIIISVLPNDPATNRILRKYPQVIDEIIDPYPNCPFIETSYLQDYKYRVIRSGSYETSDETFCASWPVLPSGQRDTSDTSILKVSSDRSRLVIVDGQHRAMALLALYRNLWEKWGDSPKSEPYQKYYADLWPKAYLRSIFGGTETSPEIDLPCIICLYPGASVQGLSDDCDVISASRSIFLILNKNARKVTSQRLTLLDDNNLISHLMRQSILSPVKSLSEEAHIQSSLRIFNVLLDESKDKTKISSPVCFTSVSNLNQILENLLLSKRTEHRLLESPSRKIGKRADLLEFQFHWRLGSSDIVDLKGAKRHGYSDLQATRLNQQFKSHYGNRILHLLANFKPFKILTDSTLIQYQELSADTRKEIVRELLFGNQGQYEVLARFYKSSTRKFEDTAIPSHLLSNVDWSAQLNSLRKDQNPADDSLNQIANSILTMYVDSVGSQRSQLHDDAGELHIGVASSIQTLYSDVFKSAAFQISLICTFFKCAEDFFDRNCSLSWPPSNPSPSSIDLADPDSSVNGSLFLDHLFDIYIKSLNSFFCPTTPRRLRSLFCCFTGDIGETYSETPQQNSRRIYDVVVISREGGSRTMDPNLWPAYKYLMIEVWHAWYKNNEFSTFLDNEFRSLTSEFFDYLQTIRKELRAKTYQNIFEGKSYQMRASINARILSEEQEIEVASTAKSVLCDFLTNLGVRRTDQEISEAPGDLSDIDIEDTDDDGEEEYVYGQSSIIEDL